MAEENNAQEPEYFCKKCNAQIDKNAERCPQCGAEQTAASRDLDLDVRPGLLSVFFNKIKSVRRVWADTPAMTRFGVPLILLGTIGYSVYITKKPVPEKNSFYIVAPPPTPLVKNARPRSVSVRFNGSVAPLEMIGKEVKKGLDMEPAAEGAWIWKEDDLLVFTPRNDWPAGQRYRLTFGKTMFPDHILLDTYRGSFSTTPFSASIESFTFHIDPRDENLKHVVATVSFSHPVDQEAFEKRISLRPAKMDKDETGFKDRAYKTEVTYDEFFGKAYLLSEPLPMPDDDVYMQLKLDDGIVPAAGGRGTEHDASSRTRVPGITNYVRIDEVSQTMVRNREYRLEQMLIVHTTGKINGAVLRQNMEAWILPVNRPETPGAAARTNYRWSNPTEVGPEILKLSRPVTLAPQVTEHEHEEMNSLAFTADPGAYMYVRIKKGTPFFGKYSLSREYQRIIHVQQYPRQLEIMHDGIILSSSGRKKVSLMAQGVRDVWFRIGRILPDQLNHLVSQTNGNITDLHFLNYRFSEENIVERHTETRSLGASRPGEPVYFSYDFSPYLHTGAAGRLKHGLFFFEIREWDPVRKVPTGPRAKRMIMVSDLGILVKDGADDRHNLYVQSVSDGRPVSGARVQVLGKNGIPVLSTYTDGGGTCSFPSLMSFTDEKEPTVYVVSRGDDLSFLPVEAPGRWLDYSPFSVGGVHGATDPGSIHGFLFSDRGIYRPGDTFNIGMIVRAGDWDRSLAGTPLEAAVLDARGLEIHKKRFKLSPEGFEELSYATENTSPTGTWQVNLYTLYDKNQRRHRHIGSTTLKIEEFLPDRLTITSVFPGVQGKGWVAPDKLHGQVTLRNLFGSPAAGNRITGRISLAPGDMWFPRYRGFLFSDPLSEGKSFSENLMEQTTDENGQARFHFGLDRFDAATYTLTFEAVGFEKEGGRNVTTQSRVLVSPLAYLVGTKADGDLSYIYKNSSRNLDIIAIAPDLEKTAVAGVRFELNEIRQVSVLTKQPNGTYDYRSVEKKERISSEKKSIPAAGYRYALNTAEPGEYELVLYGTDDMVFSRIRYSVVGQGNITRSLDRTAELELKLNKTDYEPGEMIEVYVKAPYTGAGLITIERDRVYAHQWFRSTSNSFITRIRLPEELEGNGYVNVSFVRAADSPEIFMSPLSYGVEPFSVSKKNRTNDISITVPPLARSGRPFPITYKTARPGKIVIFAVDEGILQVARYKTPDPLAHFFKKRALEVRTSQLLDLILPEFSLVQRLSAPGGGAGLDELAKNLNPFKRKRNKPVVFWSGIISADRRERTLSYTVPDYFNGTLRVMAVAVSPEAIGRFEEKSVVRNPYVISPNIPMFAAPGDSFAVSVTVANTDAGTGKKAPVVLTVGTTDNLRVSQDRYRLAVDEDGDTTFSFSVRALNKPGNATLTFTAAGKKEKASLACHLSIRPAVPYQTRLVSGVLDKDKTEVPTPRRMYEQFRVLETSCSFLPLGLAKGLTTYLDRFPYGCSEQVISQAFPYLYLRDTNGFGISDTAAAQKVSYAIRVLQARQYEDGKIGVWAANSYTSDFITVYAMHFVTECRKAGYDVSDVFYRKLTLALKAIADAREDDVRALRIRAYAVYLLTAAEIMTSNQIAVLRKTLDQDREHWRSDLTGAYLAASYALLKKQREADKIFDDLVSGNLEDKDSWYFYDRFTRASQVLYLAARHAPSRLKDVSDRSLTVMADFLQGSGCNTLQASYAVMALSAYAGVAGTPSGNAVSVSQVLEDESKQPLALPEGKFPVMDFSPKADKLLIRNKEKIPLYYQVVQAGFDNTLPTGQIKEGLEVTREFRTPDGDEISSAQLGDEVRVHLLIRSTGRERIYNVAVVDLLPAGLEATPVSVRGSAGGSWSPEYTDIREDRLVLFGTVSPDAREYVYTVKAVNRGRYVVPPAYAESMYDRSIYAVTPQDPFVVE